MRKFKTAEDNRTNYIYYFNDGTSCTITPGENGENATIISQLHGMDDEELDAQRREAYHCPIHLDGYHDGDGDDADDRNPYANTINKNKRRFFMMNKIKNKILGWDFKSIAKRYILVALCVVLVGSITSGVLLRTQISEAITIHQNEEQWKQDVRDRFLNGEGLDAASRDEWDQMRRNHHFDYEDMFGYYGRTYPGQSEFWKTVQITPPSTAAMVAVGITGIACGLLGLIYWLLVAAWLYQVAHRSGMNTLLWTLAGLVWNLGAVIVFLVVRSFTHTRCCKCGVWQGKGNFCRECGSALIQKCPHCDAELHLGNNFCEKCGKSIHTGA